MNITVYLGANAGNDPALRDAVRALGRWIGESGNAFIAFPGGTGTLEEIAEVMSRVALGQLDAPCILYNLNGYYDGLRTQLAHMIELGLSSEARQRGIYFADDLEQIRQLLDPACAG